MKRGSCMSLFLETVSSSFNFLTNIRLRSRSQWVLAVVAIVAAWQTGALAQSVFPSEPVGTSSTSQAVNITLPGGGTVQNVEFLTIGAQGRDFALGTGTSTCQTGPLGAGSTCKEYVAFTPTAPGVRMGAVVLLGAGGNLLGETLICGTGTGGLAVLIPGNTIPYAGDGQYLNPVSDPAPALTAELYSPTGVAVDGQGNLYIADSQHNLIRMVTASSGQISTVAGTGTSGYTGDNGAATAATLNAPSGVAVDGAGNLFVADTGNNVIRRVDAISGKITTVAGNSSGLHGYTGDGSAATSASLYAPQSVAVDGAGDIYIADTKNNVIREISSSTLDIATVAGYYNGPFGNGVGGYNNDGIQATLATLNSPYAVAIDAAGDLLIADTDNNRIRMVSATTGIITTVAGNGTAGSTGDGQSAANAELNAPTGIALDPAGDFYISDTQNSRIRKVNSTSQTITTLAVTGNEYLTPPATLDSVSVKGPQGLTVDSSGNVFFANTQDMQVWEIQGNVAALDFTATPVRQASLSSPLIQPVENDGNDAINEVVFTQFATSDNVQIDAAIGAGGCSTTQPLAVGNECAVGVIFAPAITPVLAVNTQESGTITADYTTTIGHSGPSSPLGIVAVGIAEPLNSTTTTVSANPDPSLFGQAVTFTVTVTTGTGTGALTGTVNIYDTFKGLKTALATALNLNTSGQATYTTAMLAVGVHSITATYSGDTMHTPSTSTDNSVSPWSQAVEEQTALSLTSSANPSLVGQSVTFTATVTAPNGGGVMPDGEVSFLDGTTTLATLPLSGTGGQVSFTTSALANGLHPIAAVYSGDINKEILGETSAVLSQVVQLSAGMTLSPSANPSYYGNLVTFTATVASSSTNPPTGIVTFFDNNVKIGTAILNGAATDVAQFVDSTLTVGQHSITATYPGDNYNTAASAGPVTQTVQAAVSVTTEVVSPSPGIAGVAEAMTATVKITQGVSTPTGTVTFTAGSTVLGTAALAASGTAAISPVLAPGNYSVVATYSGDTDDATSQTVPFSLTVAQATTTTVVAAVPNPSTYLQNVSFAATVTGTGAVPTGSVDFFADNALIGAAALNPSGIATLTYAGLTIGNHAITAVYTGDGNNATSTSLPINLTVGKIPTTTGLGSAMTTGANPQLDLLATVTSSTGAVPSGTVTFTSASTTEGTVALDATGVAALDLNLPAGSYVVVASYSGDATHAASQSIPITVTTNPVAFTISATPSTITIKSSQNTQVAIVLTSEGGFTDTVGMGCAFLPPGVSCHFSTPSVTLQANGTAAEQVTIDTNSPLVGGTTAMNRPATGGTLYLATLLAPISLIFGFCFRRSRKRMGVWSTLVVLVLSAASLLVNGCGGITTTSAAPGTYTIQVIASGSATGVIESQNIALTIN